MNRLNTTATTGEWSPRDRRSFDVFAGGETLPTLVGTPHLKLEARLGAGGMGEVYKAKREMEDGDEPIDVAVKLSKKGTGLPEDDTTLNEDRIKIAGADQEYDTWQIRRQRLLREVSVAKGLPENDFLVKVYDEVETPDGELGYSMEFFKEGTLEDLLEEGLPGNNKERAYMASIVGYCVASALSILHEHGMIHRDIKPQNIFIQTNPFRVKVGDLGIVKSLDDVSVTRFGDSFETLDPEESRSVATTNTDTDTQEGTVVGSPKYISNERASGGHHIKSDLFSLGVVMYEIMTDRHPAPSANQTSEDVHAILFDIQRGRMDKLENYLDTSGLEPDLVKLINSLCQPSEHRRGDFQSSETGLHVLISSPVDLISLFKKFAEELNPDEAKKLFGKLN